MAHSKSAEKRNRQNQTRRARNRQQISAVRTQLKKIAGALAAGDAAAAQKELSVATQRLDKAAKNRTIHPNEAARRKSRLAKKVAALKGGAKTA